MPHLRPHSLRNGKIITLHINHRAKTNIIVRAISPDTLKISLPPSLKEAAFAAWLKAYDSRLIALLAHAPQPTASTRPASLLIQGDPHALCEHDFDHIIHQNQTLYLPKGDWHTQKTSLKGYLKQQAKNILLPRLTELAKEMGEVPKALALSNGKSFWGVCRPSGIRLNWRLIGAPEAVVDYVCVHEISHIPHPNHSPAFWQHVARYYPRYRQAQQWLKQHHALLFLLDD